MSVIVASKTGELLANHDDGEGQVVLSVWFSHQPLLWQADVLKDWIGELEEKYKDTISYMREENA